MFAAGWLDDPAWFVFESCRFERMAMSKNRRRPRPNQIEKRRRQVSMPLWVEAMERRQLLATMVVNTELDENNPADLTLSLREAIEINNGTLAVLSLSPAAQAQVFGTPKSTDQDLILF